MDMHSAHSTLYYSSSTPPADPWSISIYLSIYLSIRAPSLAESLPISITDTLYVGSSILFPFFRDLAGIGRA